MPEYQFTGPYGRHYPESRDAQDNPVGDVEPGGTRDLNGPLDGDWLPADPKGDGKAASAKGDGKGQPDSKSTKAGLSGAEGQS